MHITFPDEESGHKGTRTTSRTVQPPTFENLRDTLHILTFGTRARPKEHRVNMESENPKRDTAVIDIIGREGYHLPHTSTIIVARSGLEKGRM
jgi:hypothetical protein